jgi:hypothetical protein
MNRVFCFFDEFRFFLHAFFMNYFEGLRDFYRTGQLLIYLFMRRVEQGWRTAAVEPS